MFSRFITFIALTALLLTGVGCRSRVLPTADNGGNAPPYERAPSGLPRVSMVVQNTTLIVEMARTSEEKARGLSGREGLEEGMGMLFEFLPPIIPHFWMKEMLFDLDIIWIRDGHVVDITVNVPRPDHAQPRNMLPTYSPRETAEYVLEVPAGWAIAHRVVVGSLATIPTVD